jgi:predicted metal-binding membrane protein
VTAGALPTFHAIHAWHDASPFGSAAAAWTAMMALMMTPTAAPWLSAYYRVLSTGSRLARARSTGEFFLGYLAVWAVFGCAAAALQQMWRAPEEYGGPVLVAAGLYQWSPLKRACLTHCRNPLTRLLTRWQTAAPRPARLGWWHGWYCLGCCWALMATALAIGMMNLAWMSVLAAATFVEQTTSWGERLRAPFGIALVAGGLGVWSRSLGMG